MSRVFPRPLTGAGESRRLPASTKRCPEKAASGVAPLVRHVDRTSRPDSACAAGLVVDCVAVQDLVAALYEDLLAVGDVLDAAGNVSGSECLEAACAAAEALYDLASRLAEAAHALGGSTVSGGWWVGAA